MTSLRLAARILLILAGAAIAVLLARLLIRDDARQAFFSWPNGGIWSNLLASGICSVGILFGILRKMREHHRERMAQAERHHKANLEDRAAKHDQMTEHVRQVVRTVIDPHDRKDSP